MTVWKIVSVGALCLALAAWATPGVVLAHEGHEHTKAEAESHEGHAHEGGSAGGHEDHAAHEEPSPLAVDPDLAIWTAIVFLLLLAILGKFAWGPITEALERREQAIALNIKAAKDQHEEAKQLLADYERKLATAADEVRQIMEEARRDAEQTKVAIVAEAKSAAAAEHERAMRDVRNATDGALKQLAETSADLAIELAGKIVGERLNPADHARLVREAIADFPSKN